MKMLVWEMQYLSGNPQDLCLTFPDSRPKEGLVGCAIYTCTLGTVRLLEEAPRNSSLQETLLL